MYWQEPAEGELAIESTLAAKIAMGVMAAAILILGIYPGPVLALFN